MGTGCVTAEAGGGLDGGKAGIGVAIQAVVAVAAQQDVIAALSIDADRTRVADHNVVAGTGVEDVIATDARRLRPRWVSDRTARTARQEVPRRRRLPTRNGCGGGLFISVALGVAHEQVVAIAADQQIVIGRRLSPSPLRLSAPSLPNRRSGPSPPGSRRRRAGPTVRRWWRRRR